MIKVDIKQGGSDKEDALDIAEAITRIFDDVGVCRAVRYSALEIAKTLIPLSCTIDDIP